MKAARTVVLFDGTSALLAGIHDFRKGGVVFSAHHSLIVLIVNHQSGNSDARQQAPPQAFKAEQHTGDQIDHRNGKHAQHALERQLPGILSMP